MKLTKKMKMASASLVGAVSAQCWAVDPQSIDIAGFEFTPTLVVSESYDDNYRAVRDNEQSSWVTTINPTFLLSAEDRNSAYQLEYQFDSETYHSDSEASNVDHHLVLRSVMEFTSRHRLRWNLQYHRVEDTADSVTSDVATPDENDKYSRKIANAVYTFGAEEAMNQLDFGGNYESLRYFNSGDINADEERDSSTLSTAWYHRLGGRTRSVLELRYTDNDYVRSSSERDSVDTSLLAGATWKATSKTSGSVKIGAQKKNFDNSSRDDYTTPMWEVGVTWNPRTYSTFKLDTRRAFDEGDDGASTIETITTTLDWEHKWSSFIKTNLDYRFADREYKAIDRDDDRSSYGIGVTYSPDRWVDLSLGYRFMDNDSSLRSESYDRNIFMLSAELSL